MKRLPSQLICFPEQADCHTRKPPSSNYSVWASVAPLGVFHRTTEASTLNGYNIPANSIVISNIYAMHRDPLIFPDPEKFDPTRYLDADGHFVKSSYVVAFSLGKNRSCCLCTNDYPCNLHI